VSHLHQKNQRAYGLTTITTSTTRTVVADSVAFVMMGADAGVDVPGVSGVSPAELADVSSSNGRFSPLRAVD